MNLPKKATLVEVGPRDGLQNEKGLVPTADKIRFIERLAGAGLSVIETTSFVSPKWVPQLADAAEVYAGIKKREWVSYPVLVPNLKGLERALACGVKDIAVFSAASETFTRKNINMTIDESLKSFEAVAAEAEKHKLRVRGYVSTAWVCPYEGEIDPKRVVPVVDRLLQMGCYEVSIGDTIGAAVPTGVERLFQTLLKKFSPGRLAVHFHDTRGTALANILAALQLGISTIDASAGGLGGCPYAPGASGNVATEDVVYMLGKMGVATGVDLPKLAEASRFIAGVLGKTLPSKYLQACHFDQEEEMTV